MALNTYLTFDGNCREVFEFYRSVFGGEFSVLQTFADGPPEMPVADADKSRVMHVSLPVGESVLMGSDKPGASGPSLVVGNNFSVSIEGRSREHCDEVFAKLSKGGSVQMPLQETFWGAYFGQCTDRFGISWMLNYTLPKE